MAISSVGVSKLCADLPEAACGLFPGVWVLSHGGKGHATPRPGVETASLVP